MALPASLELELGTDGTGVTWGGGSYTLVDYVDNPPELTWPTSNLTYERMRRDAKVRETLSAVTLPVRGARWSVDPNGARDEVTAFVARNLGLPVRGADPERAARLRDRFSWAEHLRLALLHLTFGHMPFEQVYRIVNGQAVLRKLAPRMPATISKIEVAPDGGLVGIRQLIGRQSTSGVPPLIGVDRLVMYVNDREGGAWQGQSVLRAAYRPWRLKEEALRVWATSLRRNGIGQPVYHGAQGEGQASLDAGRDLARRARAGEATGASVPFGAALTFEGVRGSLPDHEAFIRLQDEEIAATMLAEFLKLGSTRSGSRALGDTFVDFFTLSLQALAESTADTGTAHIVEDLVDLNFGPDEQAPRIAVDGVGTDHRLTPDQLAALMQFGVLTNDPVLEDYVRTELYHLPARDPNAPPPPARTVAASRPALQVQAAAPRDPSPHEQHVDFDQLDQQWQTALAALLPQVQAARGSQLEQVLQDLGDLLSADDLAGLAALTAPPGVPDLIAQALTDLAQAAAAQAVTEAAAQGVTIPVPTVDATELTARAHAVDGLLARSLGDVAARQALLRWADGLNVDDVIAQVRDHIAGLTDLYPRDVLGGALTAAQNTGRLATMADGPVQRVYASELLDGRTCVTCAGVDGHQYASVAQATLDYPAGGYRDCLGGPRCRGTLVAVYAAENPATVQ